MAELTTADVEQFTQGRLPEDDPETARLLAFALADARRYCGWPVTPIIEDDAVTIDGPGSSLLVLPTLRLLELTAVTEEGAEVDVSKLWWSARGLVCKKNFGCWSRHYGAITVTMTHGFADAPDFAAAVLSAIDRASLSVGGGRTVVGPFQYGASSMFAQDERRILDSYRLETVA